MYGWLRHRERFSRPLFSSLMLDRNIEGRRGSLTKCATNSNTIHYYWSTHSMHCGSIAQVPHKYHSSVFFPPKKNGVYNSTLFQNPPWIGRSVPSELAQLCVLKAASPNSSWPFAVRLETCYGYQRVLMIPAGGPHPVSKIQQASRTRDSIQATRVHWGLGSMGSEP